jgi:GNAT superfamily N-acetyltransferase
VIELRSLTGADLALGLRLKTQAGWNTTEADWRRARDLQADGCFVAELDGVAVGTVTNCIFGPVAWVALVLVDAEVRGRGVGTALMQHSLAYLEKQGVRSVRLDATPLGRPVYEKLGFVAQFELARYQGTMPAGERTVAVDTASPEEYPELVRLDRAVTHTDRGKLLTRLFAEQPASTRLVRRDGVVHGFRGVREGAHALQIGPCLATTAEAGQLLLADARHAHPGRYVFLDIPTQHRPAAAVAAEMGLTVQRSLLRMNYGEPVVEDILSLWCSSGPEKG